MDIHEDFVLWTYVVEIRKIYDGDTVTEAMFDKGHRQYTKGPIRLYGIDTPEKRGPQKKWGKIAAAYLMKVAAECENTLICKSKSLDKYGRILGELYRPDSPDRSINQEMIDLGYARPYDGGKKEEFDLSTLPVQPEDFDYDRNEPINGWPDE